MNDAPRAASPSAKAIATPPMSASEEAAGVGGDPVGEIGAEHVEGAVREVDDAEDAEDERQPARHQEQHQPVLHAVEQLDGEVRGPCGSLPWLHRRGSLQARSRDARLARPPVPASRIASFGDGAEHGPRHAIMRQPRAGSARSGVRDRDVSFARRCAPRAGRCSARVVGLREADRAARAVDLRVSMRRSICVARADVAARPRVEPDVEQRRRVVALHRVDVAVLVGLLLERVEERLVRRVVEVVGVVQRGLDAVRRLALRLDRAVGEEARAVERDRVLQPGRRVVLDELHRAAAGEERRTPRRA